ncbi:MAG TPA: gamma-glutamyl-gamma-aminobutyrate hydrolase family protein [Acidimicrobiales bacterium]
MSPPSGDADRPDDGSGDRPDDGSGDRLGDRRRGQPVIGLTTYVERARWGAWNTPVALLTRTYLDAIARAGAVPLLLPPVVPGGDVAAAAGTVVRGLDGLVLTGGGDVDPAAYGATSHPATAEVRPARDAWEIAVLRAALAVRRPVLAICRGAQVLNVARGGTLHQHIPDRGADREHRPAAGTFGRVRVGIEPGTRLAGLVGTELEVPCSHHQAIDRVGDGLRVVARAADGTVEAVEPDESGAAGGAGGTYGAGGAGRVTRPAGEGPFLMGIQWHPEEDGHDLRLFEALVTAAAGGRRVAAGRP